jgi:hypothetical protein
MGPTSKGFSQFESSHKEIRTCVDINKTNRHIPENGIKLG